MLCQSNPSGNGRSILMPGGISPSLRRSKSTGGEPWGTNIRSWMSLRLGSVGRKNSDTPLVSAHGVPVAISSVPSVTRAPEGRRQLGLGCGGVRGADREQ